MTASAHAQTSTTTSTVIAATATPTVRLIEWDLPAQADASPGAMVVDSQGDDQNRIWFVTRLGGPAHVYRMDFPKSLMTRNARFTRWDLSEAAVITGGLRKIRPSRDRRFIFVRTVTTLERIDTKKCTSSPPTCERTAWIDQPDGSDVSDVAVDDWNSVFTTHTPPDGGSYVQKLTPGPSGVAPTVTRWIVGGGAGLCQESVTEPCVAGIDINPYNGSLVYYAEPTQANNGAIAELNTYTNEVRRWLLADLNTKCGTSCTPIFGPRMLHIDRAGIIWIVTGSGHLVSLNPSNNNMTAHQMPIDAGLADPFGIAPDDDVVGYTNSGRSRVGVLIPRAQAFVVYPTEPMKVPHPQATVPAANPEPANVFTDTVGPEPTTVEAKVTPNPDGDVFVEALINMVHDSELPLGITPAKSKAQGAFFYAVANNANLEFVADRVGFVRLPIRQREKKPRDDDDRDDGWQGADNWHDWHGHATNNDYDDDGIPNDQDSPSARENVNRGDLMPLNAGQTASYSMTASSTTLALIATAETDNPLAQIGIDIFNAAGLLMARSLPSYGVAVAQIALPAAGTYTWRVTNYGGATNYTPTSIVREPDLVPDVAP